MWVNILVGLGLAGGLLLGTQIDFKNCDISRRDPRVEIKALAAGAFEASAEGKETIVWKGIQSKGYCKSVENRVRAAGFYYQIIAVGGKNLGYICEDSLGNLTTHTY